MIRPLARTITAAAVGFGALSANAQDGPSAEPPAYTTHPGYIDVDKSTLFGDTTPEVEITLEKPMLQMLSGMLAEEEPEAAEFIKSLELVRFYVLENMGEDKTSIMAALEETAKTIEAQGWTRAVMVEDDSDNVKIYVKTNGDECQGVVFIVGEGNGSAVFGNVVGNFDPATLGKILGGGMFGGGGFANMMQGLQNGGFDGGDDKKDKAEKEENDASPKKEESIEVEEKTRVEKDVKVETP